jgi:ArsR family transcriptional regulator
MTHAHTQSSRRSERGSSGHVGARKTDTSNFYTAQYSTMNALLGYLTDNCCKGAPDTCAPATCKLSPLKRAKVSVS